MIGKKKFFKNWKIKLMIISLLILGTCLTLPVNIPKTKPINCIDIPGSFHKFSRKHISKEWFKIRRK